MKKYKFNYVFATMFRLCFTFSALSLGMFISWLLINPNESERALYIFSVYNIGLILFCTVIHLLISIFTDYHVFIDENNITVRGKRILTQSILLEDVKYVVFDLGDDRRFRSRSPCSITLFDTSHSKSLTINNPSFLLICELKKRLKHATFKFKNYICHIIIGCNFVAFAILISFLFN